MAPKMRLALTRVTAIAALAVVLGTVVIASSHARAHADDIGGVEHCAACGWVRASSTTLTPSVSHTPVLAYSFDVVVALAAGPLDAQVAAHTGRGPPLHS
jgi:hypothetical protein